MYFDFKKIFSVLVLLAVGAGIGITGVKFVQRYQAPKQTVSVVGSGEIDATTDQVTIDIQIKTSSTTYEKAQAENKKDVNDLKSELTKLGIPESRITVSSFSPPIIRNAIPETGSMGVTQNEIMPTYRPNTTPTVTTNLNLVLDPIKNIEKIYDVISKNTNAQITNTYYSLKNMKVWETKAKDEALKDARTQIESVAKINHLRVGKLLTLKDNSLLDESAGSSRTFDGKAALNDQVVAPETQQASDNTYYSEQTVKITSSYTAQYELY